MDWKFNIESLCVDFSSPTFPSWGVGSDVQEHLIIWYGVALDPYLVLVVQNFIQN